MTFIESLAVSPTLSVTVSVNVYVPSVLSDENDGLSVLLLLISTGEAPAGSPVLVHTIVIGPPFGSNAVAPAGALTVVGCVILLSIPAYANGRTGPATNAEQRTIPSPLRTEYVYPVDGIVSTLEPVPGGLLKLVTKIPFLYNDGWVSEK